MNSNQTTFRIAVIPGDGIGPEVVPESLRVLDAAALRNDFQLEKETFSWGAGHYLSQGCFMPDNGLELLKNFDAVFFGSVGLPEVDDTLPARDYTFRVRTNFDQYVNFRLCRTYSGIPGPLRSQKKIDFIIIRENTEGEFVQIGDQYLPDSPHGMGLDTSIFTRKGMSRESVVRLSCNVMTTPITWRSGFGRDLTLSKVSKRSSVPSSA